MMKTFFVLLFFLNLIACSSPQTQPSSGLSVKPFIGDKFAVMDDAYQLPYFVKLASQKADAVFVAVHGFNDYSNAFTDFCTFMATNNKHCYAYDQRGFGRSEYTGLWPVEGKLQNDLKIWTRLLKEKYPDLPLYVVGESMGGAVVMTAMQEYTFSDVERFIVFAPAVWARSTQPWYQRLALWATLHTFPGWKPTGKGFERVASNNREALIANARDPLFIKATRVDAIYGLVNLMDAALAVTKDKKVINRRALLLYGAKDELIPKKSLCKAVANITQDQHAWAFNYYDKGYHMLTRDVEAEETFLDVLQWVNSQEESSSQAMLSYCEQK